MENFTVKRLKVPRIPALPLVLYGCIIPINNKIYFLELTPKQALKPSIVLVVCCIIIKSVEWPVNGIIWCGRSKYVGV